MKNNVPRYIIYEFDQADDIQNISDEDIINSSKKLIEKNSNVYEELSE